jgi:hypothetical protein
MYLLYSHFSYFFKVADLFILSNELVLKKYHYSSTNAWFISYSKSSDWHRISKLLFNFGCLLTFCYLDGTNLIKTDSHICNLWTGQLGIDINDLGMQNVLLCVRHLRYV